MFCQSGSLYGFSVRWALVTLLCLLFSSLTYAAPVVGFKEIDLDKDDPRPLKFAIWYPAKKQTHAEMIADSRVFYGFNAVRNGAPENGKHPLIVISHGYGGTWRNLSWLAADLADRGYIVAAPNHPGTSAFNRDPHQAARLAQRPHDLSRVIDVLGANSSLAGDIDEERIAALGHSLGGWTVVALAGGHFDTTLFKEACRMYPILNACGLASTLDLGNPGLEKSMQDRRIKAFISLDGGLIRGFTSQSLGEIAIPSLIIGAGTDVGDMPVALESGYLHAFLPKAGSDYVEISDAMHFSFLQRCKPGAMAILAGEGQDILCKDGGNRSREEIHHQIADLVIAFLGKNLPKTTD
ncbi:prolyl oligopeptidase family serine peptidase [Erwinia sp. S43]|nr:alpha/beta fold hydrolase [Erwinia sp. S43]MBK0032978.1 prolyl oligopeptidase family serine peptidase [Erwinia sp. S43]